MGETYDAVRDRDENNKPEALHTVTISKFHDHNPIVGALNTSLSLSTSLNSDSNSSSKSSSPDHVVPSQKVVNSPHRLSTSSGASSPQTDGSINVNYRRTAGNSHLSPDVSHNGIVVTQATTDHGRNVITTVTTKRKVSSARKAKKVKSKIGRTKKAARNRAPDIEDDSDADYVIRCICGFSDMFDKQIQCEQCEVWQHFGCMGIEPATVPDCYLCEVCDPLTFRPLQPDEARELHRSLMPRDNQQLGSKENSANKSAKRKKSADSNSIPLTPTGPTPRQPDLIQSDKKRTTTTEARSRQSSVEAALKSSLRNDDCGELSRDDRKILQYEQMFKRMEERRDKAEKRKRTQDESSLGSPTRESTKEREHVDEECHQSHGETSVPPPSPPFVSIIDFPPPLPTTSEPLIITEQFVTPASITTPVSTPAKISLKPKRLVCRAKSVVERYVEKDSPLPDSPSSVSEKVESPSAVETPPTVGGTPDPKPRFSLRLRNGVVNKKPEEVEDNNTRIELNSMKKRKEGDLLDDMEMGLHMMMLPLNKRKIRTVSFIDAYYSAMADVQTETEMQKATRRNRAYSASEDFEQTKLMTERCRLYRLYGLKKGVFARYREDTEPKLLPSASDCSSIADESSAAVAELKESNNIARPLTQSCLARYGGVLPLKRSKTVRAMIENSMQKNQDEERAHRRSQMRRKDCMSTVKMEPDMPQSDVLQRMMGQETPKPVRLPRPEKKSENVRLAVPDGSGLGSARSADVLSQSASKTVQPSGGEVIAASQLTAQPAVPNEHTAPTAKKADEKQKEPSVPAASASAATSPNITVASPVKKLTLAEYRQWKAELNRPVNNAASVPLPPAKVPLPTTLPTVSQPVSMVPLVSSQPVTAVAPSPTPARTSVIHRIGSVINNSSESRTEPSVGRLEKPPPVEKSSQPPLRTDKLPQRHIVKVSIPNGTVVGRLKQDEKHPGKVDDGTFLPPPVPYVQTHFRPAPMLAARSSGGSSSMADSIKSQMNMV